MLYRLFAAALLLLSIAAAQTLITPSSTSVQLGTPADPCTASTAYAPIPMRFGFSFSCTFNTPAGGGPYYEVTLGFREPTYTTAGGRSFDVSVNGYKVLSAFDVIAAYIADGSKATTVLRRTVPAVSSDGIITVQLSTLIAGHNAVLSSVVITPISCGQPSIQAINTIAATRIIEDLVANCGSTDASIWGSNSPGTPWLNDPQSVTLGTKFRSDVAGTVTGIRFYKGAGNDGTHIGLLYSGTGALLAQASFSGESASGWQTVNLSPAVSISANTTYIAALFTTSGYSHDQGYFSSTSADNLPLHALRDGVDGSNGVFTYGSSPQFPTQSYLSSNYWVDVVFTAQAAPSCSAGFATICAMSADQIPDNCNVSCGPASGFVGCGPALTRDASGVWSLSVYGP